ncbi:MAG TPA: peptidyl-prolyl cis-trans isomerase [Holophagaceae bacterium]|nr:peptidyl-prolyl cis-trans isomerase [Holophagaceae bacterium]
MNPSRPSLRVLLAAAAIAVAALGCKQEKPIARVGDHAISPEAFKLVRSQEPAGTKPEAIVDRLVRWEVAWHQAEKTGLLKGNAWQEAGPRIRRTVLINAYLESVLGRPMPTEAEVKGFYLSHGEERNVAHILCKTQEAAAAIAARLKKGEPFDRLVSASIDPTAPKNKGDLGWVKRDAVVPEFAKEVFQAQEGEIRGPFQTTYGWHVAVMKAKRAPSAEDFEKKKGILMSQAREMVLGPKREDALKGLRPKYPLVADEAVLALKPTPETAAKDGGRVAGTIGGVGVSIRELDAFIQAAVAQGMPDHSMGIAAKRRFLDMMGDDIRLTLAAEKAGLHQKAEVKAAIWVAERQAVHRGFGIAYLRQLKPTDAVLQAHYAQFPDRFRGVGAVRTHLLVARDPHAATLAAADSEKGVPWKTLVQKYGNVESTGNWDPGFLEVAALKKILVAEAVKALQTNPLDSVVGPLDGPEGPMLFRILERKPGEVQPLDQCKDQVRVDYLETQGPGLIETYLEGEGRKDLRIERFALPVAP